MTKLVRNNIPNFLPKTHFEKIPIEQIETEIHRKLDEEVKEIQTANSTNNLVEELGDLYELIRSYLAFKKIDWQDFENQVAHKKEINGGFDQFIRMVKYDD